ncbi:MAG: glutathione synthase [Gallionellaceae bacterium]|nr:glutathione synthase [Gallionellaceae bacterium]
MTTPLNLLFIADPLETFKTYKDSTYAMMVEAARRDHTISAMLAGDLVWKAEWVVGRTQRVVLSASAKGGGGGTSENPPQPPFGKGGGTHTTPWFERGEAEWHDLASFDAVIMRTDPPFDQAYLYATWLLEMAERQGARVFNSPRALRDFNEKLAIARYPRFIAPTLVTCHADLIREFLAEQGDIVVKPLNAMGGAMVFRLRPDDANLGAILETITQYGRETVMAQRYLPEIKEGDKRILVIAGQAVPYCLARIPAAGETRGNLAAGGTGVARPLSERDWEIARALGPELKDAGLLLVGLDVIGDCLTEVNVTSPTCFQEITQQTGFNVAGMFMDALEREVNGE